MEPTLSSPVNSESQEEEIDVAQEDIRDALVQIILRGGLSVRATNVLLRNCSAKGELDSLNEETILTFRNCGRKTVREIVHFLNVFRGEGILETPPSVKEQLSVPPSESSLQLLPLFSSSKYEDVTVADLHPDFHASTKLADLDLSVRTTNVLNTLEIESIGEVMLSPGETLLRQQNFGRKSLSELEDVIKFFCLTSSSVSGRQTAKNSTIDYASYDSMVSSFIEQCEKNKRNQKLVIKRLCFQDGKVPTLEELGQHFDITRERARQILKKSTVKLQKKANIEKLSFFWEQLDFIVSQGGGVINLGALPPSLQTNFNWQIAPYYLALGQLFLLRFSTNAFKEEGDIFRVESECLSCHRPLQHLQSFNFGSTESYHVQVVATKLCRHCQDVCPWKKKPMTFHRAFIERLVTESDGRLMLHGDLVLSHDRWQGKYCENLEEVVCHVLENNGEPMHFREIADGVRRGNKKFVDSSDHNVHAAVMRYDSIEIIDRGIYGLKSWGLGGYRSVSTAIDELLDEKGMPLKRQDILHHLQGEFSEVNISASLTAETRFTNIGGGFYDRPLNWQRRSCQDFIKLLPESVADLARYLVNRNNTSYKLVMGFIFIRSMDEEGAIYLYKLRDMFYNFYLSRHKKGLVVELDTAVMSRIAELAPADMKNKAFPKPLESFLNSNFFQEFSRNGARLRLTGTLVSDLRQGTTRDILLIIILKAIDTYFLKISPAPVLVDRSHHEVAEPRLYLHQSKSDDEPKQAAPTISIKKKGRGKIKL